MFIDISSKEKIGDPYMSFLIIMEKGSTSWSAYVPDLPTCVAVGETYEETIQLIQEAIEFHLEGIEEEK